MPTPPSNGRPSAPVVALAFASGLAAVVGLASCGTVKPKAPAATPPSLAIDLPVHQTIDPEMRGEFVGSKVCVNCHEDLTGQLRTQHARTLERARSPVHLRRFAKNVEFFDGVLNATYKTKVEGGNPIVSVSTDRRDEQAVAEYAFGSGVVGTTYVSLTNHPPLELRLSNFRDGAEWGVTPGQATRDFKNRPLGEAIDLKKQEECFLCHSTALVKNGNRLDLKRSLLGIGCETCHGPGRGHVQAAKSGRGSEGMIALAPHRSAASLRICGQCHRSPDNVDLADASQQNRFPLWQGLAISMSECFKKGQVACTTCHDPHADAGSRSRPQYNAICASCHQPNHATQRPCRRVPTGDCVSCHMPRQAVDMPTNPQFHNHWIKVWK